MVRVFEVERFRLKGVFGEHLNRDLHVEHAAHQTPKVTLHRLLHIVQL
jgi:hypothetical protein